ncbi:MAG: M48 family metallopeptidase [Candidatus Aureabacteria bacterium]|nr:M48 family metallopeptidase [Candidatus Auribacterota bacterium]
MNIYLIIIITVLIVEYILDLYVEWMNVKNVSCELPDEFKEYYDAAKYKRSQEYLKENTFFGLIKGSIYTIITVFFILFGGFNFVDLTARSFSDSTVLTGLIFAGILIFLIQIISIPFSAYHTFVIEEKYGFNKTTVLTFITDILKSWILTALIGGVMFYGIILFFMKAGSFAWVYCWFSITLFQLFLMFIAPVAIMPLFNKYIPLEKGELNEEIEKYARSQKFKMKGVFKMDASRRSTKSNAFFTGFGRFRRIALFDTLIERHTVSELVSVLAHEIGHYKKKHIIKNLIISILTSGFMFFVLSFFINNEGLFSAFKMNNISVYASLIFFGFLFSPINYLLSIFTNILSRKYEYEADAFAINTYKKPEDFINALKKLSVANLSNLTPHPLKVFLSYTHPPVLKRIDMIRKSI